MRLASLISGGGTTMEAIGKACLSGEIPFDLVCVISSNPNSGGIEKAKKLGIPAEDIVVINPDDFRVGGKVDQEKFGEAIIKELKKRKVDVVMQNGWYPWTPNVVTDAYSGMIFNQHPGPIPEFGGKGMYGTAVHAAVLEFRKLTGGEMWTEVVAQRAERDMDAGAVVKSARVEIMAGDSAETLQKRALPIEHRVQIELLKDIASSNVHELIRPPIVLAGEEKILEAARQKAIKMYPES
ncbi:MAG: formyltransferase family protein [Candidatus Curtissbacteria bacterium]|nr:formyltransferase family protein [Candidatus Curtissbacteria bacterium]